LGGDSHRAQIATAVAENLTGDQYRPSPHGNTPTD
jgi:hypothetical protein